MQNLPRNNTEKSPQKYIHQTPSSQLSAQQWTEVTLYKSRPPEKWNLCKTQIQDVAKDNNFYKRKHFVEHPEFK